MSFSYVVILTTCWGSLDGHVSTVSIPYFKIWDDDRLKLEQEKVPDIEKPGLRAPISLHVHSHNEHSVETRWAISSPNTFLANSHLISMLVIP